VPLLALLAVLLLAAPPGAEAQPAAGVHQIGFLSPGFSSTATDPNSILGVLRGRRDALGYRDGQNLKQDLRFTDGDSERLQELAADLVRLRPSIIVTSGSSAAAAAKGATTTIPIVMSTSLDPVREGLVQSLARPGGNVTGLSAISDAALIGKRLQLVKELIPGATRLALVPPPRPLTRAGENWLRDSEAAGRSTGFTTQVLEVHDPTQWDQVFAAAARGRTDVVYFIDHAAYFPHRKQIAEQALRSRMPTLFGLRPGVEAGGLLSDGTDSREQARLAYTFVHQLRRRAKPAALPVEPPTKFELVINLKTAKALGLTIPQSLLQRADEVFQ